MKDIFLQLLTEQEDEGIESFIKAGLKKATEKHNDKAAVDILNLLDKFLKDKERVAEEKKRESRLGYNFSDAWNRAEKSFLEFIKKVYWDLPDCQKITTRYSDSEHKHVPVYGETLVQTKLFIIEKIITAWGSELIEEKNIENFQFFIKAFAPEERKVYKKEKDGMLDLLRKRLECASFSSDVLEKWLKWRRFIPHDIYRVLYMARARNGGPELVKRDMFFADVLKNFDPANRTKEAIDLYKEIGQEIAKLDQAADLPVSIRDFLKV
ncbi:hypothetical protein KKB69_00495 [Patescibacteria group bacterium]|nr:hypothetical protein [Patescibacteria group bacterium]